MRLRRLEIYGFKSFADKIEIEFGDGITGIVGPNGSGKSNISDAIRWVLGEQNVRMIRGTKIEDVIFKGSKTRRASGIANVTLLFENQDDIPIDFKEVVINRRIFSTGESEFYINRNRCRLKDIADLFADTGIGLGGISIINQNRVDDILKARPEERRIFFEETIGITKYRNRKREAINKIEGTEGNIVRIEDIINELETQLTPLSAQAERTNKYNLLRNESQYLQLTELTRKHQKISEELDKNLRIHQTAADKIMELQTNLKTEEANQERLTKEVIDIEQKLYNQSAQNELIRNELNESSNEITKLNERQLQGKDTQLQIRQRKKKLLSNIEASKTELNATNDNLKKQREELKIQNQKLGDMQEQSLKLESDLKKQKDEHDIVEKNLSNLQNELSALQNELQITEHDLSAHEKSQQTYRENENQLINDIEESQKEYTSLQVQQEKATAEIAENSNRQRNLKLELNAALKENHSTQLEEEKQYQKLHIIDSRLQILRRMNQNYEGFSKAPKAVLMSRETWRNKIYGAVGELLSVPEKFTTAIEVALGGSVQHIVTEDEATAKAAIEFLKKEKLGRATFLPLSRIASSMPLFKINEVGVLGFANTLVKSDPKISKIVDFLLSKTLIVDNIDNALRITKNYKFKIVTLEGELLNIGGSISGGSSRQNEANIFSRTGEINTLAKELDSVQKLINHLKTKRETVSDKINLINVEIDKLYKRSNEINIKIAEGRAAIKQIEKSIAEKRRDLSNLKNNLSDQSQVVNKLQNHRQTLIESINSIDSEIKRKKIQSEVVSSKLQQMDFEYKDLNNKLKTFEIACAILKEKILRDENQFEQMQHNISNDEAELDSLTTNEKQLLLDLSKHAVELSRLDKKSAFNRERLAYGQEQSKIIYASKMEKMSAVSVVEKNIREIHRQFSSAKTQLHEMELKISEAKMQLDNYRVKINDIKSSIKFEITPDQQLIYQSLDSTSMAERLKSIEQDLEILGNINPNAPQEFEELNERCEFLKRQVDDLKMAKDNLQVIIKEIDDKIINQFLEAFRQIQIFFSEVFVKLFGGGSSHLELTDKNDILNSGVEIIVTLPKKKSQPLSMLSGGERALTVIALLFSFLKFRPSPFCILDEIDAPLDEANLIRFGEFVREFSAKTQFILITHRKTTMEFLDRIYGITIEDAGVSKILSIMLGELNAK